MNEVMLQAHRGVSSECPENTMPAYQAAVAQGYGVIELDPAVTADGQIVLLHDGTLNRTARLPSGERLPNEVRIGDLTYDEANAYDYGIYFSRKFRGTHLPLLRDVLALAAAHGVQLKIDNKVEAFSKEAQETLFALIEESGAPVGITCKSMPFLARVRARLPQAFIHYDGAVSDEILASLSEQVPRELLTVWVPYPTAHNTWATVEFANEALCEKIKKHASLGLWVLSEYDDLADAVARFSPAIVETTGRLKPRARVGLLSDTHTHSEHSHDSTCPISEMAEAQYAAGVQLFTVTDHCDLRLRDTLDIPGQMKQAAAEARALSGGRIRILSGLEIGEGPWYPAAAEELIRTCPADAIIGSVHAVRDGKDAAYYAKIDFSTYSDEELHTFMHAYFEEVRQVMRDTDIDILAHLTCPLRYINGKYHRGLDSHRYEAEIEEILCYLIEHGIALEINTSCRSGDYNEWMPEEWILSRYAEMGGYLITMASDAHTAAGAAHDFPALIHVLRKYHFPAIYYVENRILYPCTIKGENE